MRRSNFIYCMIFACAFLINTGCNPAMAKCAAGEVWGDLGCRPVAKPSILVKAARRIKTIRLRRKPSTQPETDAKPQ
jgi:hypothetical protein